MAAGDWISTPGGRLRLPASDDVPTTSGTVVVREGGRLVVYLTRPVLDPDNVDCGETERELEVVAAFGLTRDAVQLHLAVLAATEGGGGHRAGF